MLRLLRKRYIKHNFIFIIILPIFHRAEYRSVICKHVQIVQLQVRWSRGADALQFLCVVRVTHAMPLGGYISAPVPTRQQLLSSLRWQNKTKALRVFSTATYLHVIIANNVFTPGLCLNFIYNVTTGILIQSETGTITSVLWGLF